LKKRTKKLLFLVMYFGRERRKIKVFCFFSSKKKTFVTSFGRCAMGPGGVGGRRFAFPPYEKLARAKLLGCAIDMADTDDHASGPRGQ
jgi:hypothetical protein